MTEPECPVCLTGAFSTLLCRTPCGHKICMECALSIRKYECPTCRGPLPYLEKLLKSRQLFITNQSNNNTELPIYDRDEFPDL